MQNYKTGVTRLLQLTGCAAFVLLFTGLRHPFYLGVTEIQYNSKNQSLEISIKLFTDDFEKCLSSHVKKPINLYANDPSVPLDSVVANYIRRHFKIYNQNRNLPLEYVGYEKSEEATWSYFELPLKTKPHTLQIQNTLLFDCITEQSNILHLKTDQHKTSYKLNFPDSSYQWNWPEY